MERGGWKQKWGDGEAWIALKSTAEKHLLRHLSAKNESTTEAQRRGGKCKNPLKNAGSRFLQCSKLYWEQQGSCLSPLVPGRQGQGSSVASLYQQIPGNLGDLFIVRTWGEEQPLTKQRQTLSTPLWDLSQKWGYERMRWAGSLVKNEKNDFLFLTNNHPQHK